MVYKYFCKSCNEEFELEHKATEDPMVFLDCDCAGRFLEKMGQVRQQKKLPRIKDYEGY